MEHVSSTLHTTSEHGLSSITTVDAHSSATSRACLKRDGTSADTRFGLSAQRTSPFKLAGGGVSSVDCWQPSCAHQR